MLLNKFPQIKPNSHEPHVQFLRGLRHASHLLEDRPDCKTAMEIIKREIMKIQLMDEQGVYQDVL